MRRRTSVTDRMLEHWASWRITEELYSGTGSSAIARFREPAGTLHSGSHPLYLGVCDRRLSALNGDLAVTLGLRDLGILLVLYGLPGNDGLKMRQYGLSPDAVDSLRRRARVVALRHIPRTIRTYLLHRDVHKLEAIERMLLY